MAKEILKNVSLYLGRYEIASDVNKVTLGPTLEQVDVSNFAGDGWSETLAGLKNSEIDFEGFMEISDTDAFGDAELLAALDTTTPLTFTKSRPAAAGDVAFAVDAIGVYLTDRKTLGQAHGMAFKARGGSPMIRGKVIDKTTRSSSGNSSVLDLGAAVTSSERLYLVVHVLSSGTGTLDLVLSSDDAIGFPSATTRITVAQFSAPGSYLGYVEGPITDTFWRLDATIAGASPSFEYVAMIGRAPIS